MPHTSYPIPHTHNQQPKMNSSAAHIVLVGLPGSGKSTLGRTVAKALGCLFIDLDTAIEEKEQMWVPDIFNQKGEAYFREIESKTLRELLNLPGPLVLATGGGAPCFFDNMELIGQKACSIYLEVSFDELAQRLFAQGVARRPLLEGVANPGELVKLLKEKFAYRLPYYKKAGLHFQNTAEASVDSLLEKVQACLKESGSLKN